MASVRRASGPSARGSSSSSATVTTSAACAIRRASWAGAMALRELGRLDADGTGRPQDDLLNLQLRGAKLGFAMGLEGGAALIDGDRPLQLRFAGLQLGDDLLQFGQGLLEGERRDVGLVGHARHP